MRRQFRTQIRPVASSLSATLVIFAILLGRQGRAWAADWDLDAIGREECAALAPVDLEEAPRGPTVARRLVAGLLPSVYLSFGWRPRWSLQPGSVGGAGLIHDRRTRRRWEVGALWNPARLFRAAAQGKADRRALPVDLEDACVGRPPDAEQTLPDDNGAATRHRNLENQLERSLDRRYRRALENLPRSN